MSARRRTPTGLSGILPIDKPAGMTSHDVVDRVRRATGERRVGHAGTLDPMATGLLVVLVGPAARLASYLTAAQKSYDARVVFGTQTDTDDAEGEAIRTAEVPAALADEDLARRVVAGLVGTHEQVPPAYSAIKQGGRTAYDRARAGEDVDLAPRMVDVSSAQLVGVDAGPPVAWDVELSVSKGTYIRAIARDLGDELGTVAHLGALRRVESGHLTITDARSLERVEDAGSERVTSLFADPIRALGLPSVDVSEDDERRIANGVALDAGAHGAGGVPDGPVAIARDGRVLAIYEKSGERLRALTVIPGGVSRRG